jgi:hypothetical protein
MPKETPERSIDATYQIDSSEPFTASESEGYVTACAGGTGMIEGFEETGN